MFFNNFSVKFFAFVISVQCHPYMLFTFLDKSFACFFTSHAIQSLACGLWGDGCCFAKQITVVSAAVGLAFVQLRCFHERHGMQLKRS